MKNTKKSEKPKDDPWKDIQWEHFPMEQDELNPLIGNFVIQFERIMENIRRTIVTVLNKKGLQDDFYTEILLHDSTAGNLRDYYIAVLRRYFDVPDLTDQFPQLKDLKNVPKATNMQFPEDDEYIDAIYGKINEALQLRNTLLHASWNTNYAEDGESYFSITRNNVSKSEGLKPKIKTPPNKTQFNKVNVHLKSLANILLNVEMKLHDNQQGLISQQDLKKIRELKFSF